MSYRWAWRISAITHPLFLNFFGFILFIQCIPALHLLYPPKVLWYIRGLYFMNVVLLPLIMMNLMKQKGLIQRFDLPDRQQRKLPLILVSLTYILSYYLFQKLNLHRSLLAYQLASSAVLIFVSLLNNFIKVSLHAAGAGALLGLVCSLQAFTSMDVRFLLVAVLPLCGLILTARLVAGDHTRAETLSGLALGFLPMWWVLF